MMTPTNINLPDEQREWLERQPNGIAGTIRELVALAMRRDDRARLQRRIEELEAELASVPEIVKRVGGRETRND